MADTTLHSVDAIAEPAKLVIPAQQAVRIHVIYDGFNGVASVLFRVRFPFTLLASGDVNL